MSKDLVVKFPPKLANLVHWRERYIVLYGGRGGGKSWGVARSLILRCYQEPLTVLCTREIQDSIKDSVYSLLVNMIKDLGLEGFYYITDKEITGLNGSVFKFKGLRYTGDSVKSFEGVDICWIEEAASVSRQSLDILLPTIRKNGSQVIFVFNPDSKSDPVWVDFIENEDPDARVVNINWRDNPFISEALVKEKDRTKRLDFNRYLHVWEGQPKTFSDAVVFKNRFSVQQFPTPLSAFFYYGVDWGFASDAMAGVRCFIMDDKLYIDYECGGTGISISDIVAELDKLPEIRNYNSYADSARPDLIDHCNRGGLTRLSKCYKTEIIEGVDYLLDFEEIIIHERCTNVISEFCSYSYKTDRRTGEISAKLEDKNNHWIDALRYALTPNIRNSVTYINTVMGL